MASQHSIHTAPIAQKSTVTNQKWRGPNLGECEAAFVAAFVPPTAEALRHAQDAAIPFMGEPGRAPDAYVEWQEYGVMR